VLFRSLPLALTVAEYIDKQREQLNNALWHDLSRQLNQIVDTHQLPWQILLTEDKNAPDSLLGLHGTLREPQPLFLNPMMEQQSLGGNLRIYFGLMWSSPPTPEQRALPAISALKESLQIAHFKTNENFLGWQWTPWHPRRKDFLLRYASNSQKILEEITSAVQPLLLDFNEAITRANAALKNVPRSKNISLDQLRSKQNFGG
jgi:hypothetical protein